MSPLLWTSQDISSPPPWTTEISPVGEVLIVSRTSQHQKYSFQNRHHMLEMKKGKYE